MELHEEVQLEASASSTTSRNGGRLLEYGDSRFTGPYLPTKAKKE